jgi:hypothetical protein
MENIASSVKVFIISCNGCDITLNNNFLELEVYLLFIYFEEFCQNRINFLRWHTIYLLIVLLFQYFALAHHQCRWNYNDQDDVRNVDNKMDEYDIPNDVMWLDIEHTDTKRYMLKAK